MIKFLWRTRTISSRPSSSSSISTIPSIHVKHHQQRHQVSPSVNSRDTGSIAELNEKVEIQVPEAAATTNIITTTPTATPQRQWWSWRLQPRPQTTTNSDSTSSDPEKGGKRNERKLVMIGPVYAGCGAAMAACGYTFHSLISFLFLPRFCSPF